MLSRVLGGDRVTAVHGRIKWVPTGIDQVDLTFLAMATIRGLGLG